MSPCPSCGRRHVLGPCDTARVLDDAPDWRALLAAIVDEGHPFEESHAGAESSACQYCTATDIRPKHTAGCAWQRAVDALHPDHHGR